jgi:phosphoribosyl 1,2-cyclic phosphate phosphodiesterase
LKVTILGSGTSQGVPVIGCQCEVCLSEDPKDKRLRSSVLISMNNRNYVVDSGPDFRQQMLLNDVRSLDAILYTHEHKDHIAGMDDVRAFNFLQQSAMRLYCSHDVEQALRREFYYVFAQDRYPGIPQVELHRVNNEEFELDGEKVTPIEVLHYRLPVLGYRIRDFVYITDAKTISAEERDKIRGAKVLIINALRRTEHLSHLNLEQALELINDVRPERTYLTHISHLFDKHNNIEAELPENVFVAYDGLEIEV